MVYQVVYVPGVTGIDWETAEQRCQSDVGGHLASIHSDSAFDFLK